MKPFKQWENMNPCLYNMAVGKINLCYDENTRSNKDRLINLTIYKSYRKHLLNKKMPYAKLKKKKRGQIKKGICN